MRRLVDGLLMVEAIAHVAHLAAESHVDRSITGLGPADSGYGNGQNVHDWLHVEDHCRALDRILSQGEPGSTYCIGGRNEGANIDLVTMLCALMDELAPQHGVHLPVSPSRELITYVSDRPGHDRRYAIDASKVRAA